ncbi:hypothetical protein [Clostridium sp. KNHs216]|uniref:hypothetical protein n=1 Tax=Clostridium sp. KNHs216 TaxID=1550235 RepID=UPI00115289D0|nr:hypothetical protein [Clostridium sp. KNHs216]MBE6831321.1 hypothetical protein [Oscillospiraceae bacterium]TQI68189.1 hypothetical protein LY85_2920 [Clostridium sp. KNHs216]
MAQIIRVDILDGQTLDIELSNGHLILFDMRRLMETDRSYGSLRNLEVLPRPDTDGQSVFWRGGPRLSLETIMDLLNRQDYLD